MNDRSAGNRWGRHRSLLFPTKGISRSSSPGLDPQLWRACAGSMVRLPKVGARVFYFPQGHAEHTASPPSFPASLGLISAVPCRVLSVQLLADTETDEVYARISLLADQSLSFVAEYSDDDPPSPTASERLTSFAKTLTQSDANNGGGFSVPLYCAETIFPRLDYNADPPVQIIHARDVHGTLWKFRHVYRGTPRRHLLTTGWSNFVNEKKLVAGDTIVFLLNNEGALCVGVRRSTRAWTLSTADVCPGEPKLADTSFDLLGSAESDRRAYGNNAYSSTKNFVRNKARVTAKSVIEAATLAASGQPFEVVYYPQVSMSDFCVKAHTVQTAVQQTWAPGMRFKMAMETDDASRISWFMGTIAKVQEVDPIRWPKSPWKMLQVAWDEPDLLQGIRRLSPWQVEPVSPSPLPPFPISMKKRLRTSQTSDVQIDGFGLQGHPRAVLAKAELINPWHGFVDSNVYAGMQGVRQDDNFGLAFCESQTNLVQSGIFLDKFNPHKEHSGTVSVGVSTEQSMGNVGKDSHQDHVSNLLIGGDTTSSEPASSNTAVNLDWDQNSGKKRTSFILFGKMIDISQSGKSRPMELSRWSSSDWPSHQTTSESKQSGLVDKLQDNLRVLETQSLPALQGDSTDSTSNEVEPDNCF